MCRVLSANSNFATRAPRYDVEMAAGFQHNCFPAKCIDHVFLSFQALQTFREVGRQKLAAEMHG